MKFCPICESCMKDDTRTGSLIYLCNVCGKNISATDEDLCLFVKDNINELARYKDLIKRAPFDPTNKIIAKKCPKCNLDYMAFLRLTSSEIPVISCKCGYYKIISD